MAARSNSGQTRPDTMHAYSGRLLAAPPTSSLLEIRLTLFNQDDASEAFVGVPQVDRGDPSLIVAMAVRERVCVSLRRVRRVIPTTLRTISLPTCQSSTSRIGCLSVAQTRRSTYRSRYTSNASFIATSSGRNLADGCVPSSRGGSYALVHGDLPVRARTKADSQVFAVQS